jgi:Tol biopolymer transport system component
VLFYDTGGQVVYRLSQPTAAGSGAQWGWQIQWLPDNRAFTVFGMTGQANQNHVYLVSLREGERPVALTRDDPSTRWDYSLSPDGRHVAYPGEILRGSSLWRLDLGDALAGAGGERSGPRR